MRNLRKNFPVIGKGIRLMGRLSPGFLLFSVIQSVLKALSPFINICMSAVILNDLAAGKGIKALLLDILIMAALNLACQGLDALVDRQVSIRQSTLFTRYQWELNRKLLDLAYADVEDYAVRQLRERIRQMEQVNGMGLQNLVNAAQSGFRSVFTVFFACSAFGSMFLQNGEESSGFMNFFCSPWASAVMVVLILGNVFVNLYTVSHSTEKVFEAFAGLVPLNQVYSFYLENYIDTYHSGKDIRLYKQGNLIGKEMERLLENGQVPMKRLKGIEFRYASLASASTIVVNLFVYLAVGMRALAGVIAAGSIVRYVGGISQFVTGFTTLVNQITLLNANVEALELILAYLGKESSQASGHRRPESVQPVEIRFENVSFTYPGTDAPVLENLSFTIRPGEKLAVVGMNGSGKTTMVKLLCRLYDVDAGRILVGGIDIREYEPVSYRDLLGVVFQDFQLFSFGLGQNLAGAKAYDAKKAESALRKAGFDRRSERMDLTTSLYKDFDPQGVEVSGGEAQKIAIARALYRQSPVLVMDEPTAALDPQAEYEIYKSLNDISENKTAVFISHRMSACRFCHRVLVFDGGRLVQQGSHEELLRDVEGKYYELWRSQEQYYQ